ncbi:hypothetical protein Ddc_10426 [Ditylenchus destructor]|nr:hypothetical protein Ddc_10426 [Ditylenchus destructor]
MLGGEKLRNVIPIFDPGYIGENPQLHVERPKQRAEASGVEQFILLRPSIHIACTVSGFTKEDSSRMMTRQAMGCDWRPPNCEWTAVHPPGFCVSIGGGKGRPQPSSVRPTKADSLVSLFHYPFSYPGQPLISQPALRAAVECRRRSSWQRRSPRKHSQSAVKYAVAKTGWMMEV